MYYSSEQEKKAELFQEIEEKAEQLETADKLELLLDIIANLQGEEQAKAFKEYQKQKDTYNEELQKAQNNYYYYEKAYNILCEEIY